MSNEKSGLCRNCAYRDIVWKCRCDPPATKIDGYANWPIVEPDDWCGRWKMRIEYEANPSERITAILDFVAKNGSVPKFEMQRKFGAAGMRLADSLIADGKITVEKMERADGKKGRPRHIYRLAV